MQAEMAPGAPGAKFKLGRTVSTPGALEDLEAVGLKPADLLDKHGSGDWGSGLPPEDARANDRAVKSGEDRILSSYDIGDSRTLWVITEWDRSVTTILRPVDY